MTEGEIRYSIAFRNPQFKPKPGSFGGGAAGLAAQYRENPSMDTLYHLVFLCQLRRHEDRLRELLSELVQEEKDLERRARICLCLGQSAERSQRFDDAIVHYTQALALEPCDPFTAYFTYNNLAFCLNLAGEHSRAENLLYIALKIDPTRANAYKNLGISLKAQGNYKGAAFAWVGGTRANAVDERSFDLLERTVQERPQLRREIPELDGWLQECRCAVEFARMMRGLLRKNDAVGT